ncbi:MAG TPA: ABC transporter permease [Methylibium sp.]|uniref:ABC transporter permease n=1 Tax=Methylibium sp. TaxID=2067992 RepID=UPI002DB86E22|nr:ABC transporter permease [Methylibium sp.]HEU4460440.1 ABC transporter permease [Methylibium sp.]
MSANLVLALRSAWSRRFVLALTVASIALAAFLLLSLERLRADMRASFGAAVSGTDLVVGARGGSVPLMLYAVFRIGAPTNNVGMASLRAIEALPQVAWLVPIALGDSHRGFPVVGTGDGYFEHFRHGDRQPLALATGRVFGAMPGGLYEAVVGAEVASKLGYREGQRIVLSHGDGALPGNDHAQQPFTVVGALARTGTPVDRSVHIRLEAMEALHAGSAFGLPASMALPVDAASLQPRSATAALVGLKQRAAVFSVQRFVNNYRAEPLLAVLPGVALDELWELVGGAERALAVASALVALVSLAGMVAVIAAGLDARRRELAILRAVGAAPRDVLALLLAEGLAVTAVGVVLGLVAHLVALAALGPWLQGRYGVTLGLAEAGATPLAIVASMLAAGLLASLVPAWRAYRLSLADGLAPAI